MKAVPDELRRAIDELRKTRGNNAEPNWRIDIYRDREKMLGIIDGQQITSGTPQDVSPAVAQHNDKSYYVVFERGGTIYGTKGTLPSNARRYVFGEPVALFDGFMPDIDYYGQFQTTGIFLTQDLMMAYERPVGTMRFRRRTNGVWGIERLIGPGIAPSLVRGWADPPEVGGVDQGILLFYSNNGQLMYRHSDDVGVTWSGGILIDVPIGGIKKNPQVFRMSDYTLGIGYEYDNGITSEVYFLKTTRKYVNIASPDETVRVGSGGFRHLEFGLVALTAATETIPVGAGDYRHTLYALRQESTEDETVVVRAGGFRQVEYTGVAP